MKIKNKLMKMSEHIDLQWLPLEQWKDYKLLKKPMKAKVLKDSLITISF